MPLHPQYAALIFTTRATDPAHAYANAPTTVALRFDLEYRTGLKIALVYLPENPPTPTEEHQLTRQLRTAARGRYALHRTTPTVTRQEIVPLPRRAGDR